MIVERTREEQARYDFAGTLMAYNSNSIGKAMTRYYDGKTGGKKPRQTMAEVKAIMEGSAIYRFGAFFEYFNHGLMFKDTLDALNKRGDEVRSWLDSPPAANALGSLTLNDAVKPPYYYERLDIHTQPGNYHAEFGGFLYHWMIDPFLVYRDTNHEMGQALANGVPQRDYRKILDLGCGIGKSTMPLCDAFPNAEVHGLDYAASMLKYGHKLAESEGKAIHYHQGLAEDTGLPDESFDLITAIWLFHEVPKKSMQAIIREAKRLLRPSGVFAIMESPPYKVLNEEYSPLTEFLIDSTGRRMDDPYIPTLFKLDRQELFRENGMINVYEKPLPNRLTGWQESDDYFFGAFPWWATIGEKADD